MVCGKQEKFYHTNRDNANTATKPQKTLQDIYKDNMLETLKLEIFDLRVPDMSGPDLAFR